MRISFAVVLLLLSVLVTGCGDNDLDCFDHPDNTGCPPPSTSGCTSDLQCPAPNGVCDTTKGMCVPCTSAKATACVDTTPVCGSDDRCRACEAHDECPSSACLPEGSCAIENQVAYVAPGGSGTTCGRDSPCGTLAAALGTGKPVIKMAVGLVKDTQTTTIDGRAVTIVAEPGAVLSRDGVGVVLEILGGGADVQIADLEITGQTGAFSSAIEIEIGANGGMPKLTLIRTLIEANQGDGISLFGGVLRAIQSTISLNQGDGILSIGGLLTVTQSMISENKFDGIFSNGGSLTVTQSTISANQVDGIGIGGGSLTVVTQSTISENQGYGIAGGGQLTVTQSTISENQAVGIAMDRSGLAVIVNDFIHHNGNTIDGLGGLVLRPVPGSKVEFNTIVDNQASSGAGASGVFCDTSGFVAANNIIFRNMGGSTGRVQTFGACTYGNSFIMPGTSVTDNTPMFAHPNEKPPDYHLTPSTPSTIRGAAGPCSGVDFDNEPRPSAACDLGADQL
jgi:hypothetical protein